MTLQSAIRFSRWTAILSFTLGTCILALYYFSGNLIYWFVGYGFAIVAGIVNIIALVLLWEQRQANKDLAGKVRNTIILQLSNVPIVLFYVWVAAILYSNMRITFINTTESTLRDLQIIGCATATIDELEPGESETVWIGIPHDCSVTLLYPMRDTTIKYTVCGYLTPGMGMPVDYYIGGSEPDAQ